MSATFLRGSLVVAVLALLAACQEAGAPVPPGNGGVHVGDELDLNVSLEGCTAPRDDRTGRVVAITSKAIVVADIENPTGGFTDAEYASIGATFDTLVAPVSEAAFGAPADMDDNDRVVLFFTQAVNELTPRGQSGNGVVGGFFYARDLFPKVGSTTLQGCASSNESEMFYLLVADPTGVASDARSKDYVRRQTIATVSHEYQHLINASRRVYVSTTAEDFEVEWLNEGLSHIAEELLFYHVAGMAPRQNIGSQPLRDSPARFNAFLEYMMFNVDRYRLFLNNRTTASPWATNDELATRGATWSMLRYLADHRGTGDGDTWNRLVNSSTTGIDNLTDVFGASVLTQVRDWAVSNETDDLTGFTQGQWQQPSWNLRDIMGALRYNDGSSYPTPYPLNGPALANGTPVDVTLAGGSFEVIRFSVPANANATITWSAGGGVPPATFSVMVAANGQVQGPVAGTQYTAAGGAAGTTYLLIAHNGSTVFTSNVTVTFTGTGVGAPPAPLNRIASSSGLSLLRAPATASLSLSAAPLATSFERTLRARERQTLKGRFASARAFRAARMKR